MRRYPLCAGRTPLTVEWSYLGSAESGAFSRVRKMRGSCCLWYRGKTRCGVAGLTYEDSQGRVS